MTSALGRGTARRPTPQPSRAPQLDVSVPALILKAGDYPVPHGMLAAVRTLGRVGVPTYALTSRGISAASASRYCAGRFTWHVCERDDMSAVAEKLLAVGERIGARSVLVPLDDEAAVIIAEQAAALSDHFLFPSVETNLPRRLASKAGLRALCLDVGVPAPASAAPCTAADAAQFARSAVLPLVVKHAGVWDERNPTGASLGSSSSAPRLVHTLEELVGLGDYDGVTPAYVVQEYIPPEHAEDWIVHLYADAQANCRVLFTGRKLRSWPPVTGVTACGVAVPNPALTHAAEQFCKAIGYCGTADMDWRFDRRDGQYKLLDFNPRVGNNFRLFTTDSDIDVVRALHLDLTSRPVPAGSQADNRRLVIEHIDIPARIVRHVSRTPAPATHRASSTEYAWLAADDPLPLLAMLTRVTSLFKIIRTGIRSMRLSAARHNTRRLTP